VSSCALTGGSLRPECLADTGTTNGHKRISVVAVPLANPAAVIAEPALDPGTQQFDGNAFIPGLGLLTTTGCHDITVFMELELAAASCLSEGHVCTPWTNEGLLGFETSKMRIPSKAPGPETRRPPGRA
jgi:hypothetical protein